MKKKPNVESSVIIENQYFPSIGFYLLWASSDSFQIEQHENYNKRSLRNKCLIQTNSELLSISVPLKKGKHNQQSIRETQISYAESWVKQHQRALLTAYGKSPYYYDYCDEIYAVMEKEHETLFNLNIDLIKCINQLINWRKPIELTDGFIKSDESVQRGQIRHHGDMTALEMKLESFFPIYESHIQIPETRINCRLSILDLLFFVGSESTILINRAIKDLI